MAEDFCTSGEAMIEYDQFDYMLLFKSLESVRITSKDFLEGKLNSKDAYTKLRRQYSNYACNIKKNVDSNRSNKKLTGEILIITITIMSGLYTLWVLSQIFKSIKGEKHNIPILYALVSIIIVNPIYSFATITIDLLKYQTSTTMDSNKKDDIEEVESKIKLALKDEGSFNKESVCQYYQFFDNDSTNPEGKLCGCESATCIKEDSELITDTLASKLDKLDNVHQFFENQRTFVDKSKNNLLGIPQDDEIDKQLKFFLGEDIEKTLRENLNNSDEDMVVSENSQQIRNNVVNALKKIEGFKYTEKGIVKDYPSYFIEDTNTILFKLAKKVLDFVSVPENKKRYIDKNKYITLPILKSNSALYSCDNYKANAFDVWEYTSDNNALIEVPSQDSILQLMLELQIKLKRLNLLWLPEYENLRKIIYDNGPTKTEITIQKAIYRSEKIGDLNILFYEIIAIVLQNKALINYDNKVFVSSHESGVLTNCKSSSTIVDNIEKKHISPIKINIEELYPTDYKVKDTLLFAKMKLFIRSLKETGLNNDFQLTHKIETNMVIDIILNDEEDILNIAQMNNYVDSFLLDNNVFANDLVKDKIFKFNMNKLYDLALEKKELRNRNKEIFVNSKDEIEFPERYITFQDYTNKLKNIEKGQFNQYLKTIETVKKNIVYFVDKSDELNGKLEKEFKMTDFHDQYFYIYVAISLLLVIDVIWKTYFGVDLDIYYIDKVNKVKMNNEMNKVLSQNN